MTSDMGLGFSLYEYKDSSAKPQRAYDIISSLNKEAYRDIFLLSNQVLSKNPYTKNI